MAKWNLDTIKCYGCGKVVDPKVPHACSVEDDGFITMKRAEELVVQAKERSDHYAPLRRVLDLALQQASAGKGAERHGGGKPFDKQPMLEIGRMVGWQFCLGQAMKKTQEASRMEREAAQRELLGAINYLAGAYLLLEETKPT